jgi:NADH:ubiquinone oxidoreductase subunit 5 (subunit L)/multisubunit Na+/H+ antiporter MnhA subunit
MFKLVWLIPLLPLLAATAIGIGYITGMNRGEAGERQTSRIAVGAAALSLLLVLLIDGVALLQGVPGQLQFGTWLHSGEYVIKLSFTLDALGLSMTTLVALLSVLTCRLGTGRRQFLFADQLCL